MFIAEDIDHFKSLFVNGLKNMLSDDELGAYILVLANSQQDASLQHSLSSSLESHFSALTKNIEAEAVSATPDDLDVFEKLKSMTTQRLPSWQNRALGNWRIVLNTTRKLRPARNAAQVFDSIKQDFDDSKFHFDKPFLKPEILWEGDYDGCNLRVLYNKFPFHDYHLIVAVSPEQRLAQYLTAEVNRYAMTMAAQVATDLPGFGLAYNSLAGGASVNHLHLQGFVSEKALPIEDECWSHNSGDRSYPLDVATFTDTESAWAYITMLNEDDIAYNCIYRDGRSYVVPRKRQGMVRLPDWLSGAGWLDVAGVITVSDEACYEAIDEHEVSEALCLMRP